MKAPLNEKEKLEQLESQLKIDKLKKEVSYLDYQLSKKFRRFEFLKALGIGAVITSILALGTLAFTIYRWSKEEEISQNLRKEERLERALEKLSDSNSTKRLGAIVALRSFIKEHDNLKNSQVLLSLTNALYIETDQTVQNSIIEVFYSQEIKQIDSSIIKEALISLINLSRKNAKESRFYENIIPESPPILDFEIRQNRAAGISKSIIALLRTGNTTKDLSGVYFVKGDLSNLNLAQTNFDNSILSECVFTNSDCQNCSFNGANLEGAQFIHTNLQNSKFTDIYPPDHTIQTYFILKLSKIGASKHFTSPNFNYADLTKASFRGHPLFSFIKDSLYNDHLILFPTFYHAKLDSTDFSQMSFVVIQYAKEIPFTFLFGGGGHNNEEPFSIFEYRLSKNSNLTTDSSLFHLSFLNMSEAFDASNWQNAIFPIGVTNYFIKDPPTEYIRSGWRNEIYY
jgi:uncharacterized protein YjbI with pentapeptide repeats